MSSTPRKNQSYKLAIPMLDSAAMESFKTGLSVTDTAYYSDAGGAWTSLAIVAGFNEIGSTGVYSIDLSASEMNHDQIIIKATATGSADTLVSFDLNSETIDTVYSRIGAPAGASIAADIATIDTTIGTPAGADIATDISNINDSSAVLLTTTIATLTSQTVFTLTAGSADDDAYNNALIVITDAVTSTQKAVGLVSDYVGSTKEVTLSTDPAIFTMAVTDNVAIIASAATNSLEVIADAVLTTSRSSVEGRNPSIPVDSLFGFMTASLDYQLPNPDIGALTTKLVTLYKSDGSTLGTLNATFDSRGNLIQVDI